MSIHSHQSGSKETLSVELDGDVIEPVATGSYVLTGDPKKSINGPSKSSHDNYTPLCSPPKSVCCRSKLPTICCAHGRPCEQAMTSNQQSSSSHQHRRSPTCSPQGCDPSPSTSRNRIQSGDNDENDDLEQEANSASTRNSLRRHLNDELASASQEWMDNKEYALQQELYLGVITVEQAESELIQRTAFKLYHELPDWDWPNIADIDSVPQELPLKVVYLTSCGCYRHYPIIEQKQKMFVDYGSPDAPRFTTLSALVHNYKIYAQLHVNTDGREPDIDVFPWWLDKDEENNYENIAFNH